MLEKLTKINICWDLPAGFSVVCLTVVIFGVVGLGFGVVASKSIIQMIFINFGCVLKFRYSLVGVLIDDLFLQRLPLHILHHFGHFFCTSSLSHVGECSQKSSRSLQSESKC